MAQALASSNAKPCEDHQVGVQPDAAAATGGNQSLMRRCLLRRRVPSLGRLFVAGGSIVRLPSLRGGEVERRESD
jgi:hypothetical protein